MRKITSLLMLFCMCVGMAWGQILTTSPTAGKSYTLKCKATDHVGFIGDNGTIVHGRSALRQIPHSTARMKMVSISRVKCQVSIFMLQAIRILMLY